MSNEKRLRLWSGITACAHLNRLQNQRFDPSAGQISIEIAVYENQLGEVTLNLYHPCKSV